MKSNKLPAEPELPREDWERSDEALAYYLVSSRYRGASLPAGHQEELARIQARAATDPAFAARLKALTQHIETLDSSSATASFERITGHRLTDKVHARPTRSRPARPCTDRSRLERSRSGRRPPRLSRLRRLLLAGGGVMATVVILVLAVDAASAPTFADLAQVDAELPVSERAFVLRGRVSAEDEALNVRYRYARTLLAEGEVTTFGLFRRYDLQKVEEAVVLLHEAIESAPPESPVRQACEFLLGKAYLALEQTDRAEAILQKAQDGQGIYSEESRRLAAEVRARRSKH